MGFLMKPPFLLLLFSFLLPSLLFIFIFGLWFGFKSSERTGAGAVQLPLVDLVNQGEQDVPPL